MIASTIDELIVRLNEVRAEHGNLPIYDVENESGDEIEGVSPEIRAEEHAGNKFLYLPKRLVF